MTKDRMSVEEFRSVHVAKPHKYGAKACTVDGQRFASRKEANRFTELKLLERAGKVSGLRCQVRFPLEVNGSVVTHYVADFVYQDETLGRVVVEDAKGFKTDVYRIKAKLMLALLGIEILET